MSLRDTYPAGPDGVRRGYPVETPIGTMYINPTDWGALVDNSSNTIPACDERPYLTVRGRQYTAQIGVYADGRVERMYVNRRGSDLPAAPTVRQAIVNAALDAVERWRADNPATVARAEYESARLAHETTVSLLAHAREGYEESRRVERAARRLRDTAARRLQRFET